MNIVLLLFSSLTIVLQANIEPSLDYRSGLTYFRAAEDLISNASTLDVNRKLAEELFVLSAVIDPTLRNSVIIGLLSIQEKSELIQSLKALQLQTNALLVPAVVSANVLNYVEQSTNAQELCETLTDMRSGEEITEEQIQELAQHRFLLPIEFDTLIFAAKSNRSKLPKELADISLRIELEVLGGASVWSADFVSTKGMPVAIQVNDDLAALFNIDTEKRTLKNGVWVK
jgi:hypothetical protein